MKQLLLLLFLLPTLLFAQQNLQLNREWGLKYEKEQNNISVKQHKDSIAKKDINSSEDLSCFKPYIVNPEYSLKDKSK